VAGLLGVTAYLGIGRYETEIEQFYATRIDYASPRGFAYTVVLMVALAVAFCCGFYTALGSDLIAPVSEWFTGIDSLVILSGAVLGLALGAGYPPVMQRQDYAPLLSLGQWASELDGGLFVAACYVLLSGSGPLSVLAFGVAYFGSRLAFLGSVYGSVRADGSTA